ncbi:MAG: hypothetical protein DLM50_00250 [Candidatus Meridianibacter frigidus]|nr:MAG: hypothetical protein DLM50_00250 [Candidatus Eremiobacteraeota bacterium]
MEMTATRVKGIDATYYTVEDLDGCTKFYSQVLGLEPAVTVSGMFAEWTFDDDSSFGLYKSEQKPASRSGSAMFRVDDPYSAAEHLKSMKAHIAHGEDAVGDFPTCFMVFGEDPEGNQFIIHKRK